VTDDDLVALGFDRVAAGMLIAPSDSKVSLIPIGHYFELRVSVGEGDGISVVVPKVAVKIIRQGVKL